MYVFIDSKYMYIYTYYVYMSNIYLNVVNISDFIDANKRFYKYLLYLLRFVLLFIYWLRYDVFVEFSRS